MNIKEILKQMKEGWDSFWTTMGQFRKSIAFWPIVGFAVFCAAMIFTIVTHPSDWNPFSSGNTDTANASMGAEVEPTAKPNACRLENGQFVIMPGASMLFQTTNGPLSVGNFTKQEQRLLPSQIYGLKSHECFWGTEGSMFSIENGVPTPK